MEKDKIKIQVNRRPGTFNVDIILYSKNRNNIFYYTVGEHGELNANLYVEGQDPFKPTITLPENEYRNLLQAFAEEAKGQGIETHESYVKGKLEATEAHLEDMRTLLFKKK